MISPDDICDGQQLAIVGPGRLGGALARTLGQPQPHGRGFDGRHPDGAQYSAVLLCVPDAEIEAAAATIAPGPLVGHCSGARGLEPLSGHEAFSLHPLMTVTAAGADFRGAGAAVDGSTARAIDYATALARKLGMEPFQVLEQDRVAYHAAASIASNFLVALEAAAEQLAATAGVDRHLLVPLVRATIENWAALGGEQALTGPVVRGDLETIALQRQAVSERAPQLTELFDAMVAATRALAVPL